MTLGKLLAARARWPGPRHGRAARVDASPCRRRFPAFLVRSFRLCSFRMTPCMLASVPQPARDGACPKSHLPAVNSGSELSVERSVGIASGGLSRLRPAAAHSAAAAGREGALRALRLRARASSPSGPRDLPLALTVAAAIIVRHRQRRAADGPVGRRPHGEHDDRRRRLRDVDARTSRSPASLVAFCAVIAPGGYLLFMLTLLLAARRSPAPRWVGEMLRWAHHFQMWSMLEVMMLGILVALIKIAELATVEAGIGMYAVGALMLLFPAIMVTFDRARALAAASNGPTAKCRRGRRTERCRRGAAAMTTRRRHRRAGRTRVVRGLPAAVAARRAATEPGFCRRCGEELEFRRHALDREDLGARHRRGDLLHPGQRAAGAEHDHARGARRPTRSWAAWRFSIRRDRGRSRSSC